MTKLKLELDAIEVTSFQAADVADEPGTVQAHLATPACPLTRGIDSCWCSETPDCI